MLNTATPTHLQVAMPALSIQQQSWVVTETLWSTKLKVFAIWHFTEKVRGSVHCCGKESFGCWESKSRLLRWLFTWGMTQGSSIRNEGSCLLPLVDISVMELKFLLIDWIWRWWRGTKCEFPISACTMTWMVDQDSKWRKGNIEGRKIDNQYKWGHVESSVLMAYFQLGKKMNKKRDVDFGSVEFSLLCECYPLSNALHCSSTVFHARLYCSFVYCHNNLLGRYFSNFTMNYLLTALNTVLVKCL